MQTKISYFQLWFMPLFKVCKHCHSPVSETDITAVLPSVRVWSRPSSACRTSSTCWPWRPRRTLLICALRPELCRNLYRSCRRTSAGEKAFPFYFKSYKLKSFNFKVKRHLSIFQRPRKGIEYFFRTSWTQRIVMLKNYCSLKLSPSRVSPCTAVAAQ